MVVAWPTRESCDMASLVLLAFSSSAPAAMSNAIAHAQKETRNPWEMLSIAIASALIA